MQVSAVATIKKASRGLHQPDGGGLPPPLKWAGGKRWQVPDMRSLYQGHERRRFVEPFCGGLAVTLALSPARALANDVNPHVINFYQQLRRGLTIDLTMESDEKLFYAHRDRFNALLKAEQAGGVEAAALFYYLNRTGYNGLCRFNSAGGFNVPFGHYRNPGYRRSFEEYRPALSGIELSNVSFEALKLQPTDFVYADPPYDVPFTSYSKGGFRWEDQVRVAQWLSRHPGPVVLVNQATVRIVELYASFGFSIEYRSAPRRISCTGDRTAAREVIATRNV